MAGVLSPYAPGIVDDPPAPARPPGRPALFVAAAFVMGLIGPGVLFPSWRAVANAIGIAT